jgi:hypothetical protein
MMRALLLVVVVLLPGCGPAEELEAEALGIVDAGACVPCEGEDGAQFAESTLAWQPIRCSRTCP